MQRVVTGASAFGTSSVTIGGPPPTAVHVGGPSHAVVTELWGSDLVPPSLDGPDPAVGDESVAMGLAAGAFRARFVELPAGTPPFFHRTPTLDVVLVVSGSVTLLLTDGSETLLEPGDAVVQRATEHAWRTEGDEACMLATFVVGTGDE